LIGCNAAANAGAKKSALNKNKEILNNRIITTETPLPIHQVKSKQPLIWIGYADFDESIFKSPGAFTGGDAVDEKFPGEIALGTTVEVDLMNCAGYLATAEFTYIRKPSELSDPKWHLKVISEKVAADAEKKINLCHSYSKYPYSCNVFAIAPQNNKRRDIKVGKVNTRKLFASLDKETREMANTTEKYVGREKNNLTLFNDNWTDIDGDGQIDLV